MRHLATVGTEIVPENVQEQRRAQVVIGLTLLRRQRGLIVAAADAIIVQGRTRCSNQDTQGEEILLKDSAMRLGDICTGSRAHRPCAWFRDFMQKALLSIPCCS
jgi:hypothetical protein